MRVVRTVLAVFVLIACHKDAPAADPKPVAPDVKPAPPAPSPQQTDKTEPAKAPAPTPPAAKLDPKLLDAALKAKKIKADDVLNRTATATSAWAIVVSKRNDLKEPAEYLVLRVRASETAEARISPPKGQKRLPQFDAIVSFEARDLDGDGTDEGILVATWKRQMREAFPKTCSDCVQVASEEADQLYVFGGSGTKLATGFSHLVSYKTTTDSLPEGNDLPVATEEDITYTWTIEGKPPVVKLTRTKLVVAKEHRVKGTLDPAKEPLLVEAKATPLAFN